MSNNSTPSPPHKPTGYSEYIPPSDVFTQDTPDSPALPHRAPSPSPRIERSPPSPAFFNPRSFAWAASSSGRVSGPRPASSVYSEYVPPYLDPQRSDRVAPLRPRQRSFTVTGIQPASRERNQPSQDQTNPVQPSPPRRRRTERGRGIVTSSTTEGSRRTDMYFDQSLGEMRPIPSLSSDAAGPSGRDTMYFDHTLGGMRSFPPRESWDAPDKDSEEGKEDTDDSRRRRRDKLRRLGRGVVQVVRDLTHPRDKKDRDDEERKANLAATISAPLGTSRRLAK